MRLPLVIFPSAIRNENQKLTASALALKCQAREENSAIEGFPEFELADETYVETRESKNSLEREMVLKAFSESGIHAVL